MAYNEFMFEKAMEKKISVEAVNWMLDPERPKSMWARYTIDSECKSDHVTNNVAESFNSWLGDDVTVRFLLDLILIVLICVYLCLHVINCLCVYFG